MMGLKRQSSNAGPENLIALGSPWYCEKSPAMAAMRGSNADRGSSETGDLAGLLTRSPTTLPGQAEREQVANVCETHRRRTHHQPLSTLHCRIACQWSAAPSASA
jgi:hypothetical protein